ncbi:MAG: F-box protein [Burkholderiales bacterium]
MNINKLRQGSNPNHRNPSNIMSRKEINSQRLSNSQSLFSAAPSGSQSVDSVEDTHIFDLPDEVLAKILSKLNLKELLNLSLVNSHFNNLSGLTHLRQLLREGYNFDKELIKSMIKQVYHFPNNIIGEQDWLHQYTFPDTAFERKALFAWLRDSPKWKLKATLIKYLYILENVGKLLKIRVISDKRLAQLNTIAALNHLKGGIPLEVELVYDISHLKKWVEKHKFPLNEEEYTELSSGILRKDKASLNKYLAIIHKEISNEPEIKRKLVLLKSFKVVLSMLQYIAWATVFYYLVKEEYYALSLLILLVIISKFPVDYENFRNNL